MAAAQAVGQYSGFSSDYHDFEQYVNHSYAYAEQPEAGVPANLGLTLRGDQKQWWCCLFPWMAGDRMELENDGGPSEGESSARLPMNVGNENSQDSFNGGTTQPTTSSRASSTDEDEDAVSTSSDMFGEKLSTRRCRRLRLLGLRMMRTLHRK